MCKPIKIDNIPDNNILLHLINQTNKAMGCLMMEPDFIDPPEGPALVDIETNADHCRDHLNTVFGLLLKLKEKHMDHKDLNDPLYGFEATKKRLAQMNTNFKFVMNAIKTIYNNLCTGPGGTWQDRVQLAVKASKSNK